MKTLDDAVIELNGVLPANDGKINIKQDGGYRYDGFAIHFYQVDSVIPFNSKIFSGEQFQQRAKELGFINGYRYGVEYKTDGKRPDLLDDVLIDVKCETGTNKWCGYTDQTIHDTCWDKKYSGEVPASEFKITDQRYKPADTSYLEKPALEPVPEEEGWYDYENQKALRLPPAGEKVEAFIHWAGRWSVGCVLVVGHDADGIVWRNGSDTKSYIHSPRCEIRPLDYDRKAKAERNKIVDAALDEFFRTEGGCKSGIEALYDKGFLKLPETKGEQK